MGPSWPVSADMLPGELFSAWLVRVALLQGCDPLALTGALWPDLRVWTRDPDRGMDAARLRALARLSGVAVQTMESAMLRPVAMTVSDRPLAGAAIWPWMLSQGTRNRSRQGGLQCCPACLDTDRHPYYRLRWRLAWHVACDTHNIALIDRCHACGSAIQPHRLVAMTGKLTDCALCGMDLRQAPISPADDGALTFQHLADSILSHDCGHYGNALLSTPQWFALAGYFTALLRCAAKDLSTPLARGLSMIIGASRISDASTATGLSLELLPVAERSRLFKSVGMLLGAGPTAFRETALRAGMSAQSLMAVGRALPPPVEAIAASLPYRNRNRKKPSSREIAGPVDKSQVKRAWARLKRKMQADGS